MENLFKNFKIQKYLDKKPPSDNSFDTDQEIKTLKKIPMNKKFVEDKDNIVDSFRKTSKLAKVNFPEKLVKELVKQAIPIMLKIKKHHNRPRPKALAKKKNIKLEDIEMSSMKTASYPSGHSAQGILVANVLSKIYPKASKAFKKTGEDISYSRNVARAHYKSDSDVGKSIGNDMYNHIKNKI
mgnify:FL=1